MSFGPAVPFRLPVPRGKRFPLLPGRGSKGEREAIILPGKDVGNGKSGKFRCFRLCRKTLKKTAFFDFSGPCHQQIPCPVALCGFITNLLILIRIFQGITSMVLVI